MKTILTLTFLELLIVFRANSQVPTPTNASAPTSSAAPSELGIMPPAPTQGDLRDVARFQNETVSRILGLEMKTYGIIPQAVRTRNPLQLINPFAPSEYGDGSQNTSFDPESRRANGYTVFGVKF